MKETEEKTVIKLTIPKKEREFLKEGEQLIVRSIRGDIITLIRPQQGQFLEQFRGIWEKEKTDKIFKTIAKHWKTWKTSK